MKYFLTLSLFYTLTSSVFGQSEFERVVKEYYRVDPFHGTFSGFIEALSDDTALNKKQIFKQTDTTGYYLRGQYNVFNPFSTNANKVDMIFYETFYTRSERVVFNFYTYQLTVYFDDTERNRKMVKKDYNKLVRKLRRDYYKPSVKDLKAYEGIEDGEITGLANENLLPIDPAVVSWQTLTQTKQLGLTIITRFRQLNNYAYPL